MYPYIYTNLSLLGFRGIGERGRGLARSARFQSKSNRRIGASVETSGIRTAISGPRAHFRGCSRYGRGRILQNTPPAVAHNNRCAMRYRLLTSKRQKRKNDWRGKFTQNIVTKGTLQD